MGLKWLERQTEYPKVYWREKGQEALKVALGLKEKFEELPSSLSEPVFGSTGFSFPSSLPSKEPFSSSFFFTPKEIISLEKEELEVSCPEENKRLHRLDTPDFPTWEKEVEHALHTIEQNLLDKVVLARKTKLVFEKPLNPFFILQNLLPLHPRATCFLIQLSKEEAFIGASPESLYQRKGLTIETEAIAGTKPRGKTEAEDLLSQATLLASSKERREFLFVKQFLQAQLAPICSSLAWEEDSICSTSTVHHLYNRLKGKLKEKKELKDTDLVRLLHPTPAIAGFPRPDALTFLQKTEQFQRGWFSAPLGWISPEESHLVVAIRSAHIRGCEMTLFAGSGIVAGSNPFEEWDELNYKMGLYLHE